MLWKTGGVRNAAGPPGEPEVQVLTVRLLIPSEKAPICLTVPSESSI